jgi:hypothetical protein
MNFLQKLSPALVLRVSLAASYIYSGYDLLMHPKGWYWAINLLPEFVKEIIDLMGRDQYLKIQGAGELMLGFIFLAWFLPRVFVRYASLLVVLQMAAVLIFIGLSLETFRDVVILGAGLALFLSWRK